MLIMQLGREHGLYLPHAHLHSGAAIGSLHTRQRVVLLVGSVGMTSPSGLLMAVTGLHGGEASNPDKQEHSSNGTGQQWWVAERYPDPPPVRIEQSQDADRHAGDSQVPQNH